MTAKQVNESGKNAECIEIDELLDDLMVALSDSREAAQKFLSSLKAKMEEFEKGLLPPQEHIE